jgi:hypothetical protein
MSVNLMKIRENRGFGSRKCDGKARQDRDSHQVPYVY